MALRRGFPRVEHARYQLLIVVVEELRAVVLQLSKQHYKFIHRIRVGIRASHLLACLGQDRAGEQELAAVLGVPELLYDFN